MGSNQDNAKAPARKNASNACKGCRESKIKCDGQQPCSGCVKKEKDCTYDSRDDKRRVQLRTAVQILSRRVQQLGRVIVDAGKEVPPLSSEDHEFLDRVLGTLGFSNVAPYEPGISRKSETPSRPVPQQPEQQPVQLPVPSGQPLQPHVPVMQPVITPASSEPTIPAPDGQQLAQNGNIENLHFSSSDFGDVAGLLASLDRQQTEISPDGNTIGSNVLSDDHISPDWPFPSLDNMLNFDLYDPGNDLTMQFLAEPSDFPMPVPQEQEEAPAQEIEQAPQDDANSSGDEENSELVNQLSERLGSLRLAPDGKLRYFGTASNLHLIDNSKASENFMLHTPRTSRIDKQRLLEVADLSHAVDLNLEDHLIRLFFTWHNPSSYIIDEEVFYMARQSWFNSGVQNSYYNDVLKDAMCAIGASFGSQCHSTLITYPRSMPEFFSDRAKILLDSHLDSPCVATTQALVLLATIEETNRNIARGWLFGGMAMRVAFDLGLHIDSTEYIRQGILTPAEGKARQVAFWGCYVSNLLWSFHLGRPFSLDESEITVKKPEGQPATGLWRPYPTASLQSMSGIMPHKFERPDLTHRIFEHWIFLCHNISTVAHAVYSYTSIPKAALQELSEETTTELFAWKDSLPDDLQIDSLDVSKVHLPHLLMLHMEYHHLQIFLHRPWTSHHLQPQPSQGPGVHHARAVCATSAREIARLLRIYEMQYSFRFINVEIIRILSSAALILIFATVPLPHREIDGQLSVHLNTCFRALDELSSAHDSAKETRGTLLAIQRRWNDLYGRRAGQKRTGPNGKDEQRKKIRSARQSSSVATSAPG